MKNATAGDIAKIAAKLGVSKTVARLSLIGEHQPLWAIEATREREAQGRAGRPEAAKPRPPAENSALTPSRRGAKPSGTRYNSRIVAAFFAEHGVPPPVREHAFAAPERKFRFDFAWPLLKVALEVEGGVWTRGAHGRGSGIVRDIEKYNLAASTGWRVLRCVPGDLCLTETADLVKRTMAASDL